jgi:hypothetical protein
MSLFVQYGVSARPWIGGMAGSVPVLRTIARRARNCEVTALAGEAVDGRLVVPVVGGFFPDPQGHRSPVRGDRRGAGQAGNPPGLGDEVGGADHHLGRHAAEVRAFAADQPRLDAGDVQARLGQGLSYVLTAWSHAQDDDVGI